MNKAIILEIPENETFRDSIGTFNRRWQTRLGISKKAKWYRTMINEKLLAIFLLLFSISITIFKSRMAISF